MTMIVRRSSLLFLTTMMVVVTNAADTTSSSSSSTGSKSTPPAFFLQDPTDSLCFAGETFKRCSIDTLFYVVGSPGEYRIHKRPTDGSMPEATDVENDDGMCISKKSCKDGDAKKAMEVKINKCSHCGAKLWNILGDNDTGYMLVEGENGTTCLYRERATSKDKDKDGIEEYTTRAMTGPCDDSPYTTFSLQFASAADIVTMSSPGARLIGAASDGDKKTIQQLLKEGIDINTRDWDDLTALIPAASAGHLEIVKFLIKEGIDINAKDKDGITALMEASIMGHVKVVDYLLDQKANVDDSASSQVTALWLAASEGKTDVIKSLLKKDADATNTRVDGITAVMTASAGGHTDTIALLLDNGADITAKDTEGSTALMNAAEHGKVDAAKVLIDKSGGGDKAKELVNAASSTGFTALIIAAAQGHKEMVEYLISAGADVNAAAESDVTPLMYAAAGNHADVVAALLGVSGIDIEKKHTNGGTAIMEAATSGSADTLVALINGGANVDFYDSDNVTPLMAITAQGNVTGQQAVLTALQKTKSASEMKEYVNVFSDSGGSVIMFAAAGGYAECGIPLIALGADLTIRSKSKPEYVTKLNEMVEAGTVDPPEHPHVDGVTALHVAAQGGHLDMVKLLLEHDTTAISILDEEQRTPLLLAIQGNYGEVASELVKAGADPNMTYKDNKVGSSSTTDTSEVSKESSDDAAAAAADVEHNMLFDAIMVENEDFAKLLIEKGADLYFKDDKKVTTLLQASHRGLSDVVQLLLESHAKTSSKSPTYIDDPSDEGVTPLIAASSEGHVDVVKLLVEAKANVNAKDTDETTALMAAAARGNHEICDLLIKGGANMNEQNTDGHTALMFAYNGKNQVETLWERYNLYVQEAEISKKGASSSASSGTAEVTADGDAAVSTTSGDDKTLDDGGTGPIIREALDNHIALIDLLLKSGADTSMKDKEGHTAKDFDYQPDSDQSILDQQAKAEKIRQESTNEL